MSAAVAFYRGRLGFETLRRDGDGVQDTDFGTHEFSALDLDGNLIGFFTWVDS